MSVLKLGVIAKDKLTGFMGTVTGKAEYLTGCNQLCLQPPAKEGGEYVDGRWFDEGRLIYMSEGIMAEEVKADKNGSDYTVPIN